MNRNKPYQYPPAPWEAGELVRFYLSDDLKEHGKGAYEVAACDHCFTWLDGFPHQVSNWRLKKVKRRQSTAKRVKA